MTMFCLQPDQVQGKSLSYSSDLRSSSVATKYFLVRRFAPAILLIRIYIIMLWSVNLTLITHRVLSLDGQDRTISGEPCKTTKLIERPLFKHAYRQP